MFKAVIFDFFGVLEQGGEPNKVLLTYIRAKLKPKHKIGIISNSIGDWTSEILAQDIELFDDVVLSYKVGVTKPNPAIYEMSLKNLGVRADESIFVEDIESYCEAAREMGMQSIHYGNFEQMESELEPLLSVSND